MHKTSLSITLRNGQRATVTWVGNPAPSHFHEAVEMLIGRGGFWAGGIFVPWHMVESVRTGEGRHGPDLDYTADLRHDHA